MVFLFYFVVFFILVRVWVLLIESNNAYVISVGACITFLVIASICFRCRLAAMAGDGGLVLQDGVENPAHTLFRNAQGGLSDEMIEMLHCYEYSDRAKSEGELAQDIQAVQGSSNALLNGVHGDLIEEESGLSASAVASRQSRDRHWERNGCSICLAEYFDGEQVIQLPCQHIYHRPCVVEWLVRRPMCPLCKQDVRVLVLERHATHILGLGGSANAGLSAAEAGLSSAVVGISIAPSTPTEGASTEATTAPFAPVLQDSIGADSSV